MATFENFEPIFGEPVPERSGSGSGSGSDLLRRCLLHVYASDSHHLTVHVSDFISGCWETVLSVSKLDDMRDTVGVGGSWSDFVEYVVASLKSDNVKLVLEGDETARLVSQKAKGLPRIVIPLKKMVDSSASEAMANLSLELFKAFKTINHLKGKASSLSAASDDNKEKRHSPDKVGAMPPSRHNSRDSFAEAKQAIREANPIKLAKRVPVHRRTRKRGAILQDPDEENG